MNKWQKGVLGNRAEEDEKILKRLKKTYQQAEKDIDDNIAALMGRTDTENLQSIAYQVEYQKALKIQINGILDSLNFNQFTDISQYLTESYENGFIGVMYDLQGQGIPLTFPIDQELVVRSLKNNSKLSKNLWGSLYDRNSALQNKLRAEVSRGFSQGHSYAQIAKSVSDQMGIGFNKVSRIVRTESHRISNEAAMDALYKAKDNGADVVKQWDATIDKRTRPHHAQLDGQIRELDEPFEVAGRTAMYPGGFGNASEDIHCRCAVLQRAKWALDEDELNTLKERAKYFGLDKSDSFEEFKKKYIESQKLKEKLASLTADLAEQQKKLAEIDNKTYSGIWKDDVKVSDYSTKKGSIQAKRDYYLQQIANGNLTDAQIAKYQKYLDDLDEFEKLGKQYEAINDKIKLIQADIKKYSPKPAAGEAFTQARKDNAYWFTDDNGSTRGADGVLRGKSGDVWRNAVRHERDSIYDYTQSYHKFNEPLRGYEYGTNRYLGVGNVDFDQIGVYYGSYRPGQVKKQINSMTSIIDKSSYDFDIWVQRGCGRTGMDKFFGVNPSDFDLPEDELAKKLVGTTPTEYGFMSTGVAKGKGFGGDIILNVYCPEGTKMMYAEPFSAFGNGSGQNWDGISGQSSFGYESEMILQRGTKFRITKVEKKGDTIYVDMDVIGQEPMPI